MNLTRLVRLAPIAMLALACAVTVRADEAPFRVPQVPVSSATWTALLADHHEPIDIHTQQRATQLWDFGPISPAAPPRLWFELAQRPDSFRVGLYGVEQGVPVRSELFSSAGPPGSFVLVVFREGDEADLYSFDEVGVLQGIRRMPGISPRRVGFYAQWSSAISYTEDARHPDARAQALSFASVVFPGSDWIGFEPRPNDGTQPCGFDDAILSLERLQPGLPALTRSWGQVKTGRR